MRCTECGAEIPDEARFCDQCGTPVSSNEAKFDTAPLPIVNDTNADDEANEQFNPNLPEGDGPLETNGQSESTTPGEAEWQSESDIQNEAEWQTESDTQSEIEWQLETNGDSDEAQARYDNLPTISIPATMPMVTPPSPPKEPVLERKVIVGIAIIASAFAILILVGALVFLRTLLL